LFSIVLISNSAFGMDIDVFDDGHPSLPSLPPSSQEKIKQAIEPTTSPEQMTYILHRVSDKDMGYVVQTCVYQGKTPLLREGLITLSDKAKRGVVNLYLAYAKNLDLKERVEALKTVDLRDLRDKDNAEFSASLRSATQTLAHKFITNPEINLETRECLLTKCVDPAQQEPLAQLLVDQVEDEIMPLLLLLPEGRARSHLALREVFTSLSYNVRLLAVSYVRPEHIPSQQLFDLHCFVKNVFKDPSSFDASTRLTLEHLLEGIHARVKHILIHDRETGSLSSDDRQRFERLLAKTSAAFSS
jgi:hypothetical protein